jgi:hypothetical protein
LPFFLVLLTCFEIVMESRTRTFVILRNPAVFADSWATRYSQVAFVQMTKSVSRRYVSCLRFSSTRKLWVRNFIKSD